MRSAHALAAAGACLLTLTRHLLGAESDRDAAAGGVSEGLLGLAVEIIASETASEGQYVWETVRAQACEWALTQKQTLAGAGSIAGRPTPAIAASSYP